MYLFSVVVFQRWFFLLPLTLTPRYHFTYEFVVWPLKILQKWL